MKDVLHKNESRGLANHGWLTSRHTFSFANYHNPDRMNFGLLRVLNDDVVQPSMGFGTHPHENMEIISIPLSGALRHEDSTGNRDVIRVNEVQVMSAGSGLTHSEYNDSDEEELKFLQIWIFPKEKDIEPRYGQKSYDSGHRRNRFQELVTPENDEETLWINQEAWLSLADISEGQDIAYTKHRNDSGVYFFVIDGRLDIDGYAIERRDGLGLVKQGNHCIKAATNSQLLAIEVPMS